MSVGPFVAESPASSYRAINRDETMPSRWLRPICQAACAATNRKPGCPSSSPPMRAFSSPALNRQSSQKYQGQISNLAKPPNHCRIVRLGSARLSSPSSKDRRPDFAALHDASCSSLILSDSLSLLAWGRGFPRRRRFRAREA